MNKSSLVGAAVGAAAVLSVSAVAGYHAFKGPAYAEVEQVTPVYKSIKTSAEVCKDVPVVHRAPVKDENRIAGTVIGGVLGGVLGNQVGHGFGNQLATVAGAAGGAYAGNKVQQNLQDRDTATRLEKRCHKVDRFHDTVVGYNVRYRLDGKENSVQMAQAPSGNRIPVEQGKLVLNSATGQAAQGSLAAGGEKTPATGR